jgi:hypothetical protein
VGYRMDRMLRHAVSLVLVALIGATPIVREVCRVVCAEPAAESHAHHAAEPAASGGATSHHHHGTPTAGEPRRDAGHAVSSVSSPRDCCDGIAPPIIATAVTKLAMVPPAALPHVAAAVAYVQDAPPVTVETTIRPPVPLALRTPLRV